ncbi:unnamed protein product [Mytilus edulis]|uniref:Immunoglobulin I-set domain-containing protein n=1 Tax=Mytilus edulis TaxID=6550 RepID=A0A8S3UMU5_MYTED|nr:unnamed protein product [Mytilus edulis]
MYSGSIISSLLSLYITTSPVLQTDAHQAQSPGFIRSSYGFDRKFPICNRSIQRFIGEDVKIQCKWQSEFVHETKWTLNGKEIKQSERTKTIATRDNNNVDTVEIFRIDKNDYGTYQLWISGNSTGNGVNKDSKVLFKGYDSIDGFDRKRRNRNLNVPPFFVYPLETAYAIIGRNYVINKPELKSKSNTNIHVEVILCTTALTYGNHSLFVTREYYNETIQKKQTVTTRLRLKYIVLPDKSYNIYGKGNNGTQPYPFENSEKSYLEEEIITCISCSFRQIIEVSLFAFSFIFIWKHLFVFLHRNVISTVIIFIFSLGASTEKECPSDAYDYEYDVLIVSTENDKDFVTENTIITNLEDKNYTVCFPERDFDPGIPFLDSYSEVLRSKSATKYASVELYQYLCSIVGTPEHVKTIRLMNTIRDNLSSDTTFVEITSGSFGEGLEMQGSDFDLMKIIKSIEICENPNIPFFSDKTYFAIDRDDTQPGFTQLRLLYSNDEAIFDLCIERQREFYFSSSA